MWNYCTLFDSFYLSRGLALYESLKTHSRKFHLYIFAFDNLTFEILKKLNLQDVSAIPLSEFETPELLEVKSGRTKAEYCWTCTPSTINFVINNYNVSNVTYLDSDLVFYSDPSVLIEEMINYKKNVLITEHRFSTLAGFYEKKRAGRFCVQFVTFTNEKNSLEILEKWRLQCVDWCYARHEDGKFGDQKYLDDWPATYHNVHILQNLGGGIAPWNLQQYHFIKAENSITGRVKKTGSKFKVVFFHFQYVKFIESDCFDIGWYLISSKIKDFFYQPYIKKIANMEKMLHTLDNRFKTGYTRYKVDGLKSFIKIGLKKTARYNIMKINY